MNTTPIVILVACLAFFALFIYLLVKPETEEEKQNRLKPLKIKAEKEKREIEKKQLKEGFIEKYGSLSLEICYLDYNKISDINL